MDDIGKAFTFPFYQKEWGLKVFIGSLFLLLCIVGLGIPVIAGYMVRVCQRVMSNEEELLPEWSDIGILFVTGIKYIVVYILYQLPIILLMIPLLFFVALGAMVDLSESAALIIAVYTFAFLLLAIPYSLLFTLLIPVITYRFAMNEKIADGLDIAGVFRDFRLQWPTVTVFAILIVIVKILAMVGILIFLLGVLATYFYSTLVFAALSGLLYRGLHPPAGATG
jgi:hypothetical protein